MVLEPWIWLGGCASYSDAHMLLSDFKSESTVGLVPSLVSPINFITAHVQPSIIWHSIDIVDDDIPYYFILVGWVVSILSSLRQSLVVVEIYSSLDLLPPFMCNGAFDETIMVWSIFSPPIQSPIPYTITLHHPISPKPTYSVICLQTCVHIPHLDPTAYHICLIDSQTHSSRNSWDHPWCQICPHHAWAVGAGEGIRHLLPELSPLSDQSWTK